jgi:26S proteasome regulatory subunit N1
MGLGLAYAGSARVELQEALTDILLGTADSVELAAMAALSLGLIFVGKCNEEVAGAIIQTLCESIYIINLGPEA